MLLQNRVELGFNNKPFLALSLLKFERLFIDFLVALSLMGGDSGFRSNRNVSNWGLLAVVEDDLREVVKTHLGFLVLNIDHAFIVLALAVE